MRVFGVLQMEELTVHLFTYESDAWLIQVHDMGYCLPS